MSRRWSPFVALSLVLGIVPQASARILHVPTEYPTISQACCASVSGDTVAIDPGYYDGGGLVKPGVAVIGLGQDSTDVVVTSSYGVPFGIPPGDEESFIENLAIDADGIDAACLYNGNPHFVIRNCYLATHGWMNWTVVGAEADTRVERCTLFFAMFEGQPIHLTAPCEVIVEDCVWSHGGAYVGTQPAGSRVILRNNTILDGVWVGATNPSSAHFSVRFVNNIMKNYAECSSTCVPDTVEWLYNDYYDLDPGHSAPDCGIRIGNISADPRFCNPSGYDYRIDWQESPCRNAGMGGEDIGARLGYCNINTGVEERPGGAGAALWLSAPWPSPSGGGASVLFQVPTGRGAQLRILDLRGRLLRVMLAYPAGGSGMLRWDGRDEAGRSVPAGTYFLQLVSDNQTQHRMLAVVR